MSGRELAMAAAALGALGLAAVMIGGSSSSSPPSSPRPPSGGGGSPPGGGTFPPPSGGDSILLPQEQGPAREAAVLEAVRRNWILPVVWWPIDLSRGAHQASGQVSSDAIRLRGRRVMQGARVGFEARAEGPDFARVCCGHATAQRIADLFGASLGTSRTADRAYQQATVRLSPHPLGASADMATTQRMLAHHDAVERELDGRTGLVRDVGKDWVNAKVMGPGRGVNFGWHTDLATYHSPMGFPVLQPIPGTGTSGHTPHDSIYSDYSQQVTLLWSEVSIDGSLYACSRVLQDPELCGILSDEGPLLYTRHPDVPAPGGQA
jgi:hypothetical protein